MRERKFKLFISKLAAVNDNTRAEFLKAEAVKKMHLDQLSDRQIE
jgi:hypothetical protein